MNIKICFELKLNFFILIVAAPRGFTRLISKPVGPSRLKVIHNLDLQPYQASFIIIST